MQNRLPGQLDHLFTLAEDMAVGCHNHEATLGLMQNKEANMLADLTEARTAENTYQAAKTAKVNAINAQSTADDAAAAFIVKARDFIKTQIGTSWSQMWAEVGFVSGSLAVPPSISERLALLMSIKICLDAHAAYQNAGMGVTPALALAAHTALASARATVNACRADLGAKKEARDMVVKALRKRMRGLITELGQLLPGDDSRWHAFGLNPPNAIGLPEVPDGLAVVGGGSGHLLATWESAGAAARYRVYKKVVGVDNEFVLATTVTDTESNLNTFTPGQVVRVRVSAVNDAGESLPSDSVEQVVP